MKIIIILSVLAMAIPVLGDRPPEVCPPEIKNGGVRYELLEDCWEYRATKCLSDLNNLKRDDEIVECFRERTIYSSCDMDDLNYLCIIKRRKKCVD